MQCYIFIDKFYLLTFLHVKITVKNKSNNCILVHFFNPPIFHHREFLVLSLFLLYLSISFPAAASARPQLRRPFEELMSDVMIVISGYQNPLRGNLRQQAAEMGAKYAADWGRGCTHLM